MQREEYAHCNKRGGQARLPPRQRRITTTPRLARCRYHIPLPPGCAAVLRHTPRSSSVLNAHMTVWHTACWMHVLLAARGYNKLAARPAQVLCLQASEIA